MTETTIETSATVASLATARRQIKLLLLFDIPRDTTRLVHEALDLTASTAVEMCMGMRKTGIPWDSHGNGNTISYGNGNKTHGNGNLGVGQLYYKQLQAI